MLCPTTTFPLVARHYLAILSVWQGYFLKILLGWVQTGKNGSLWRFVDHGFSQTKKKEEAFNRCSGFSVWGTVI